VRDLRPAGKECAVNELTCVEMVESITDYLEGALPADELARFRDHLLCCDGCEAYLDQMRTTVRLLRTSPQHRLSRDAEGAIVDTFRQWSRERTGK
jgi:anti-sigma factor RsiW